ncbi:hypothetical protein [Streptomyces sp. NPDC047000]|uniref:hypothetical protein n=1 Tax=Streptomyces sp. NPDC047000 TaxID=3155474 RepID=UPI0034105824
MLLGLQRSAGNSATARAIDIRQADGTGRGRPRPWAARLASLDESEEPDARVLPPYLLALEAGGLSTAYGVTGHRAVAQRIGRVVGHEGGSVADIAAALGERPETFYGQGRAFVVEGTEGRTSYDVTVRIARAPGDRPPVLWPKDLDGAEDKATKVDVQHNTAATVSDSSGSSHTHGLGGTAFGLAPVAPALWVGAAARVNAQPFQASRESRGQKNVAEPRVLRSDKGSVEVPRQVRYLVRVKRHGTSDEQRFSLQGGLTMRVPTEHLVHPGTRAPAPVALDADTSAAVAQAGSLGPVAVSDTAAPHQGGGGLFDAVASVLHPSLTAPGSPGRARLYEVTSTTAVLEDLPRLLADGVMGEDLPGKDPHTTGSYRMKADITHLAPSWSTGKTQLRTHQHAQHTVTDSAGKGRAAGGGVGPAIGVGVMGSAAAVRGTAMPTGAARKARFSVAEQTVSSRKGAEVRGEKVLCLGTIRLTVEGTGPRGPQHVLHPEQRVAHHVMTAWLSLRADEARSLGLNPPFEVKDDFISRPRRKKATAPGADAGGAGPSTATPGTDVGEEEEFERRLPFGAMGSSVVVSRLDTKPLLRQITEHFAGNPELRGYLPPFGTERGAVATDPADAEQQRHNYRELVTALSETNIRVNKDQLLTSGVRVRLRRKSRMHAHDVQLTVKGSLGDIGFEGDIKDWLVRSHSGVAAGAQSGRASSRSLGGLVLGQARLIPGALSVGASYEKTKSGGRRNQAGPATRTDVLTNGGEETSAFHAPLRMDVTLTKTSRLRKTGRALVPGSPGQDTPEPTLLGGLVADPQDIRLLTPTAFTLDDEGHDRLTAATERRRARPGRLQEDFTVEGIGDLAGLDPPARAGRLLPEWTLVETVGDGQPIRDLALDLLAKAAAKNKRDPRSGQDRKDEALGTEGLAPRLAIEERFSPQAITGALRQAVSSGWVVKNLRYPRRLAALHGAVGTRIALANAHVVHEGSGPGTETFILGGHQSGGQRSSGTASTVQGGATGSENGPEWRAGQGVTVSHGSGRGGSTASALSGTVERNAHTPRKQPLYLVQCDLVVRMVAEATVGGGKVQVAKGVRTLPAAAAVWLTAHQLTQAGIRGAQLPESARKVIDPDGTTAAKATTTPATAGSTAEGAAPAPAPMVPAAKPAPAVAALPLGTGVPLGFGMIERLPNFVPLLAGLRAALARGRKDGLAERLLPRQQVKDRNDNVQRLLRVLDKDGATGLLSSAMDGGITVELLDGRGTPYWAEFQVRRQGPGTYLEQAADGRDMEFITSAVSQRAESTETSSTTGVDGMLAGSAKPDVGAGQLKSLGGAAGFGVASGEQHRSTSAGRGQLGMKTVAEAKSAPSVKMNVPLVATLDLYDGKGGRVGHAAPVRGDMRFRILEKDLSALNRVRPVAAQPEAAPAVPAARDADPGRLAAWRSGGVRLPLEAQVNGFMGAPRVRHLLDTAVREAGGNARFRDRGQAAAYALKEAVSTEWLTAALPLLTSAGVELPPVHATGVEGQDLTASLHARLRAGKVLGTGDSMTFETVAQSDLSAPRPSQTDGVRTTDRGKAARGLFGSGLLNADEFRLNQFLGNTGGAGGATDGMANASGSMPLHKPKLKSVLVQFTLDVRAVAEVTNRMRSSRSVTAVRDVTLPYPVIVRMPEEVVRRVIAASGGELGDDDGLLTKKKAATGAAAGGSGTASGSGAAG